MANRNPYLLAGAVALFSFGLFLWAPTPSSAAGSTDFNGDGREDLAISSWLDDVDGINQAGAVTVLYGSRPRLTTTGSQFLTQGPGPLEIGDTKEPLDRMRHVGSGDFNGDGFDDLVIGAPAEDLEGEEGGSHGIVFVLYGSKNGLDPAKRQILTLSNRKLPGAFDGDSFGVAPTSADLNLDGRDDLIVGAPGRFGRGAVYVLYGGRDRLRKKGYDQIAGGPEITSFGASIAVGQFDRSRFPDIAIGAPGATVGSETAAGRVGVYFTGKRGAGEGRDRIVLHQNKKRVDDQAEPFDRFGTRLASGDPGRDGLDELVVSAPSESMISFEDGLVHIFDGGYRKLKKGRSEVISPFDERLASNGFNGTRFGDALAMGDLDGDRRDDLAIGAPDNNQVHVLFGRRKGIAYFQNRAIDDDTPGFEGDGDLFLDFLGEELTIVNVNGRGPDELVIGEQQDDSDREGGCGSGILHILYPDRERNLLSRGYSQINQDLPGIAGNGGGLCDGFGSGLTQ